MMKTCARCDDPIKAGQQLLRALDQDWHQDCFVCSVCDKPFTTGEFVLDEDDDPTNPMHKDCLLKKEAESADRCTICRKPLMPGEPVLMTGDKKYHQSCFTCGKCGRGFDGTSYILEKNKPYHTACVTSEDGENVADLLAKNKITDDEDTTCDYCGKEIDGSRKIVPGMGTFHPKCFKCGTCGTSITGKRYYEHPDASKPMCEKCMKKLSK